MIKRNLQRMAALGLALSVGLVPMTALAAENEVPSTQEETATETEVQEPVVPRSVQLFGNRDYSGYTDEVFSDIEFEIYGNGDNFIFTAGREVSAKEIQDKFFEIAGEDKRCDTLGQDVYYGDENGIPHTIHYNNENGVFHELTLYTREGEALNGHNSGFPDFIGFPSEFVDQSSSYFISSMTLYNDSIYKDGNWIGWDPDSVIKYEGGYPLSFDKEAYLNEDGTLNEAVFESDLYRDNTVCEGNAVHYGQLSKDVRGSYAQEWYAIIKYGKFPFEVSLSEEAENVEISFFPSYMNRNNFADKDWEDVDTICTYGDFTFALRAKEGYVLDKNSISVTVENDGQEYPFRSWINDNDFGFNFQYLDTNEEGNEIKSCERVEVKFDDWTLIRMQPSDTVPEGVLKGKVTVFAIANKEEPPVSTNPDPIPTPSDTPSDSEEPNPSNKKDIDTDKMNNLVPITVTVVGTAVATGYALLLANKKKKKVHGIWSEENIPGTKVKGKRDLNNIKMWFVPEIAKDTETKVEAVQRILGCEVYTLFPEDTKFSLVTAEGSVSVESEEALYNKLASMEGFVSVCIDSASKNIHLKVDFNN